MLTQEEINQISKEMESLVKITLEEKNQACSSFVIKRMNGKGIVVDGSPLNLWDGWEVVNFGSLFESGKYKSCFPVFSDGQTIITSKFKVTGIKYLTE